jgi:hypothetical protein
MPLAQQLDNPSVAATTRTLLLSGYEIETAHRQPTHAEILCTAPLLGVRVPLLIALTDEDEFSVTIREHLSRVAKQSGRTLVRVSRSGSECDLSWRDFLDSFGGGVPSWHALGPDYPEQLGIAASNSVPPGLSGEAWRLFEQLVADGLEFCFARLVRRLGAVKRGSKVSDLIAQLPDGPILVVDAKATAGSFDAAIYQLRPLIEYTKNQQFRQRGYNDVFAALIVSKSFSQDSTSLASISREFLSETTVPACFISSSVLGAIVSNLKDRPNLRGGIKWRKLFAGGMVSLAEYEADVKALLSERY